MTKAITAYERFITAELNRMIAEGKSCVEASEALGLTTASVYKWAKKLGIKFSRKPGYSYSKQVSPTPVRFQPYHLEAIKEIAARRKMKVSPFIVDVVVRALRLEEPILEAAE